MKICGLMRREDVRLADRAGADYLGVVLSAGFRRSVDPVEARALVEDTRAAKVAVLVDESPDAAAALATGLGASVIQLHGDEGVEAVTELRRRGDWTLWKAVRVQDARDIDRVVDLFGDLVEGILVEGWRAGVVGGGGAEVAVEPTQVRARIPRNLDFVLAGGLRPGSVGDAVALFRPDVVDVSSGIEGARGVKDPELVRTFIESARMASRLLDDPNIES